MNMELNDFVSKIRNQIRRIARAVKVADEDSDFNNGVDVDNLNGLRGDSELLRIYKEEKGQSENREKDYSSELSFDRTDYEAMLKGSTIPEMLMGIIKGRVIPRLDNAIQEVSQKSEEELAEINKEYSGKASKRTVNQLNSKIDAINSENSGLNSKIIKVKSLADKIYKYEDEIEKIGEKLDNDELSEEEYEKLERQIDKLESYSDNLTKQIRGYLSDVNGMSMRESVEMTLADLNAKKERNEQQKAKYQSEIDSAVSAPADSVQKKDILADLKKSRDEFVNAISDSGRNRLYATILEHLKNHLRDFTTVRRKYEDKEDVIHKIAMNLYLNLAPSIRNAAIKFVDSDMATQLRAIVAGGTGYGYVSLQSFLNAATAAMHLSSMDYERSIGGRNETDESSVFGGGEDGEDNNVSIENISEEDEAGALEKAGGFSDGDRKYDQSNRALSDTAKLVNTISVIGNEVFKNNLLAKSVFNAMISLSGKDLAAGSVRSTLRLGGKAIWELMTAGKSGDSLLRFAEIMWRSKYKNGVANSRDEEKLSNMDDEAKYRFFSDNTATYINDKIVPYILKNLREKILPEAFEKLGFDELSDPEDWARYIKSSKNVSAAGHWYDKKKLNLRRRQERLQDNVYEHYRESGSGTRPFVTERLKTLLKSYYPGQNITEETYGKLLENARGLTPKMYDSIEGFLKAHFGEEDSVVSAIMNALNNQNQDTVFNETVALNALDKPATKWLVIRYQIANLLSDALDYNLGNANEVSFLKDVLSTAIEHELGKGTDLFALEESLMNVLNEHLDDNAAVFDAAEKVKKSLNEQFGRANEISDITTSIQDSLNQSSIDEQTLESMSNEDAVNEYISQTRENNFDDEALNQIRENTVLDEDTWDDMMQGQITLKPAFALRVEKIIKERNIKILDDFQKSVEEINKKLEKGEKLTESELKMQKRKGPFSSKKEAETAGVNEATKVVEMLNTVYAADEIKAINADKGLEDQLIGLVKDSYGDTSVISPFAKLEEAVKQTHS